MGEQMSLLWAGPFVGMLLSIGLVPLFAPHFWHQNFPKIAIGWATLLAIPFLWMHRGAAVYEIAHILLLDYVPFVLLLWALFVVSSGVLVRGTLTGTPMTNSVLILIGTAIASWIGTTGASMLLIRPLLRANAARKHKVHTIVFFIFLVSNIGGTLTPLGDPPLFLGFLHNVPFFWTLEHLWPHLLVATAILICTYYAVDSFWYSKESPLAKERPTERQPVRLLGKRNFALMIGVLAAVLLSGYWKPNWNAQFGPLRIQDGGVLILRAPVATEAVTDTGSSALTSRSPNVGQVASIPSPGQEAAEVHDSHDLTLPLQNIARDLLLVFLGLVSLRITPKEIRAANGFSWFPILEVAWLFSGIFMTIIPVLLILKAGENGAMSFIVSSVETPAHYFWVTGTLSSFLDNAPTYLTFLNTALGRFTPGVSEEIAVAALIKERNEYLIAISVGAVFMGAVTYIGNAPNFMVRAIAEEARVKMPNFFAYMFKYSLPILGATFLILTVIFF